MKAASFLFLFFSVALTACSTGNDRAGHSAKTDPETVMVTYSVKSGSEAEFQAVLLRAWRIYRADHLVFARPHSMVRDAEAGGKTRFVEIFTWVSHAAPEHSPDDVKAIWQQEHSLCEARDGHGGIQGGEVELITGK